MTRRLAAEEGMLAGTSTGLNVAGAIAVAGELGPARTAVTLAVDTGLKYLDGNLFAGSCRAGGPIERSPDPPLVGLDGERLIEVQRGRGREP